MRMERAIRTAFGKLKSNTCRVPDDWLLHNRRGLLLGREVLRAVLAGSSVREG